MAERLKAAVLKTANPQGFVGSNPTPSAMAANEKAASKSRSGGLRGPQCATILAKSAKYVQPLSGFGNTGAEGAPAFACSSRRRGEAGMAGEVPAGEAAPGMGSAAPDISVVMSCRDESLSLPHCIANTPAQPPSFGPAPP